jgi:hypothetical protein
MQQKWRETSEKDLSTAESRRDRLFCSLRRQKRLSRRLECSKSGARRLKKTSQLLRAGELADFQPEKAEKAVSEIRMERKWYELIFNLVISFPDRLCILVNIITSNAFYTITSWLKE